MMLACDTTSMQVPPTIQLQLLQFKMYKRMKKTQMKDVPKQTLKLPY
jgi:hypothetical protein